MLVFKAIFCLLNYAACCQMGSSSQGSYHRKVYNSHLLPVQKCGDKSSHFNSVICFRHLLSDIFAEIQGRVPSPSLSPRWVELHDKCEPGPQPWGGFTVLRRLENKIYPTDPSRHFCPLTSNSCERQATLQMVLSALHGAAEELGKSAPS